MDTTALTNHEISTLRQLRELILSLEAEFSPISGTDDMYEYLLDDYRLTICITDLTVAILFKDLFLIEMSREFIFFAGRDGVDSDNSYTGLPHEAGVHCHLARQILVPVRTEIDALRAKHVLNLNRVCKDIMGSPSSKASRGRFKNPLRA
jgi:hypothetical protein